MRGVHLRSCVKSLLDFSFSLFLKDTAFRCCVTVVDHVYSSHFFSGSSLIRFPVVTHLVGKKKIYILCLSNCVVFGIFIDSPSSDHTLLFKHFWTYFKLLKLLFFSYGVKIM